MEHYTTAPAAVDRLKALYSQAVSALREALFVYLDTGQKPDPTARKAGWFSYPLLRVHWDGEGPSQLPLRAYGRMTRPGTYETTLTRPELFEDYLAEQLGYLERDYGATFSVGASSQEIPYPYVLDGANLDLNATTSTDLARWFPATDLAHIGNEIADGLWQANGDQTMPLALFDGLRTDFSLARLKHYTGAPAEHVQGYVLMTNYHRYVDAFVDWAIEQLRQPDSPYTALSCAGGVVVTKDTPDAAQLVADAPWRKHQMPAYHLMAPGRRGITLVNIGVGPSNAKTITDHLAVLRPHAWLMIGHCGGLRPSQTIGDYVLAHAYLRDDHVLDSVLPREIPIPPIAEVQQALQKAAELVTGEAPEDLKRRLRTGTIVTTDDRNWELQYSLSAIRFSQSRAVGIDMESATIAAQGYRFRVPYGTLLCVSDKPLHGELKLPGQANRFYDRAIGEHIRIGIKTVEVLRDAGNRLHSRKLRAFDEPPFR